MSFTAAGNTDYFVSTKTFSKNANDELLKANGNYQFWQPTRNGTVWDFNFIIALDAFLTNNSIYVSLSTSDRKQIDTYLAYADILTHTDTILNSLDDLLSVPTDINTIDSIKDKEWVVS